MGCALVKVAPTEGWSPPDVLASILMHSLVQADNAASMAHDRCRRVEQDIADAGLSLAAMRRTIRLLTSQPETFHAEEVACAGIMQLIGVPGVRLEAVEVAERITDETQQERADRLRSEGWCAAVLNRPSVMERGPFREGYSAFLTALKKHNQRSSK